jgi:hypothetical protein
MPHPAPIRPSIALAAFAEKFVDGRRIIVFGNALSPFWEQLIERGARLVHVCDSDTTRVSEAAARNTSQHVSFAPLGGGGLAVRDGAFDVGFVENLTAFADPAGTLHKLRRALSVRGIALVAAPNPDVEDALIASSTDDSRSLDYYSLYDLVHREFPVVRMAGQMPFVGYSVAELAPADEPVPCLDAGFVPGGTEEPEWFVAIASQLDVAFDAFVVVQLPHNQLTKSGAERLLRDQLRAARSAERSAVERLSRLEAEQRKLADAAERHQKDVDLARQMRLMQEELERKESWILQLEARAATADARADEADQELDELRARVGVFTDESGAQQTHLEDWRKTIEQLETEKCELVARLGAAESLGSDAEQRLLTQQTSLAEQQQRGQEQARAFERQLEAQKSDYLTQLALAEAQRGQVEQEFGQARRRIAELTQALDNVDPLQSSELARLEDQLRERGERIRELQRDLKRTEELGARLVRELDRAKRQVPVAIEAGVGGEPTAVSTVATENWTCGPTATTPASTELSAEQASAWTESTGAAVAELQSMRDKLDRLATVAARQQADLGAYDWRLQQLQQQNASLSKKAEKLDEIQVELDQAHERLQRDEVLFSQLGARRQQ